jgi:hypothetical protein
MADRMTDIIVVRGRSRGSGRVVESNSDRKLTSTPPISGAQLRAARALLKWSGTAIGTEGERKAIILVFQSDSLVTQWHYYLWRGDCYLRYQPGSYQVVGVDACSLKVNSN